MRSRAQPLRSVERTARGVGRERVRWRASRCAAAGAIAWAAVATACSGDGDTHGSNTGGTQAAAGTLAAGTSGSAGAGGSPGAGGERRSERSQRSSGRQRSGRRDRGHERRERRGEQRGRTRLGRERWRAESAARCARRAAIAAPSPTTSTWSMPAPSKPTTAAPSWHSAATPTAARFGGDRTAIAIGSSCSTPSSG